MLKIFKNYPYETSILDDFTFYEKRYEDGNKTELNNLKEENETPEIEYFQSQLLHNNQNNIQLSKESTPLNINNQNLNRNFYMNNQEIKNNKNEFFQKFPKRINSTDNILQTKNEENEEDN